MKSCNTIPKYHITSLRLKEMKIEDNNLCELLANENKYYTFLALNSHFHLLDFLFFAKTVSIFFFYKRFLTRSFIEESCNNNCAIVLFVNVFTKYCTFNIVKLR